MEVEALHTVRTGRCIRRPDPLVKDDKGANCFCSYSPLPLYQL